VTQVRRWERWPLEITVKGRRVGVDGCSPRSATSTTQTDDPRPAVALDIHSPDRRHRSSFPRRYATGVGGVGYALVGLAATAHAGR
jgi:hypothetical protein